MELGNFGDHKSVGEGVFELRIDFGPCYRVYYGRDGDRFVILLVGGTKKRQALDIATARNYWSAYKQRNEMPTRKHRASDYLRTPEDIVAYLNAALEEWDEDPRLLMKAFRNVAEARGGVSKLARRAKLDRVALSRALSGRRNPRLDTLAKVVAACGVKLRFET